MRIGLISDIHFSYSHGTKTVDGVNIREQDVYDAAFKGIRNLLNANVDVILDLGDMAHVPNPRKRALLSLVSLISEAGDVDFYSANGNHTLQRSSSDITLYMVLQRFCRNFHGYTRAGITDFGGYIIPYGTSSEVAEALAETPSDAVLVAGHWAASDVPFVGDHVPVADLPTDIPVFLGHYHTRSLADNRTYIGSTERYAWGEWQNPTGVAVYDTDSKQTIFIEHDTRKWLDIHVNADNYLEPDNYEQVEESITRVSVDCSAEEYASLDMVAIRKALSPSLEYQIRRQPRKREVGIEATHTESLSLEDGWREHIGNAKLPRGVVRKEVALVGADAIASAL